MKKHSERLGLFALGVCFLIASADSITAQNIPFTFEGGLILIKAKVYKDISVDAAVATGLATSMVNLDFVFRNKITQGYTSDRNGEALFFVDVPRISIGDGPPDSFKMKGGSMADTSSRAGRPITLVLGADYFKGKILQIDFKDRVIRFLKDPVFDYKTAIIHPPDAKTFVYRMDQLSETFLGQPVTLPVINGAIINGAKLRSSLDTYFPYPVSVSADAIKEFSLGQIPAKGTTENRQLNNFSFAGANIPNIPAVFAGKDAGFDVSIKDHGAIIGVAFLQNYCVTFDWKDKYVVLQRT